MRLVEFDRFKKVDRKIFIAAVVLALITFLSTLLMYKDTVANNFVAFFSYPVSLFLLIYSFRGYITFKLEDLKPKKKFIIALIAVSVAYFMFHFYNYDNAPWNNYGLFDDGAWDIFDARLKCFTNDNFEIIFFDRKIGNISRELVFHYYMSILFRLFGYNMLTFNTGLIVLGYFTVIFTMLTAYEISEKITFSICSALTLLFLPLNFTQVYMGHRYAICGPLLMISYYCIVKAFKHKAFMPALIGGIFAGLTMSSSIMGKQYIYGLIACLVFYGIFLFVKKKKEIVEYTAPALTILLGYVVSVAPLYGYIFTHKQEYNIRQESMTKEFFEQVQLNGIAPVKENLKTLFEMLFAPSSFQRQFSIGYPVFPWFYAVCFVLGIICILCSKRFAEIIFAGIPIAGCVIAIAYDFRILISAPFICIIITSGVFGVVKFITDKIKKKKIEAWWIAVPLCVIMLFPQLKYLKGLAEDPHSEYLLPHGSVAVSRYMQDLAVGSEYPNFDMKDNEFNRGNTNDRYDLFVSVRYSYAHIHAFLGGEYSREILKLCGDFPYMNASEEDIRRNVYDTIQEYYPTNKDLMLAFEYSDQVDPVIEDLLSTGLAEVASDSTIIDDEEIIVKRLYIHNEDIAQFKELTQFIQDI